MTLVELVDVFAFFIDWDTGDGYIGDIPTSMIIEGLKEWFEKKEGD